MSYARWLAATVAAAVLIVGVYLLLLAGGDENKGPSKAEAGDCVVNADPTTPAPSTAGNPVAVTFTLSSGCPTGSQYRWLDEGADGPGSNDVLLATTTQPTYTRSQGFLAEGVKYVRVDILDSSQVLQLRVAAGAAGPTPTPAPTETPAGPSTPTPEPSATPEPTPPPTPTPAPAGWKPGKELRNLDFETGDYSQWDQVLTETYGSWAIVKDPVAQGTYAAKATQVANPSKHLRAELQNYRAANGGATANANPPAERWYQYKVDVVRTGTITAGPADFGISQFRLSAGSCFTGGFSFEPATRTVFFQIRGGTPSGCSFPVTKNIPVATLAPAGSPDTPRYGKWMTVQVHEVWSNGPAGRAQVWVDGAQKVDYQGPTTATNTGVVMFRVGIYAGVHTGTHEVVYDDAHVYGP